MNYDIVFEMASNIIGGLAIFLFGMKQMSDGMQLVAGEKLRRLIQAVTDNRLKACAVGTAVTCVIQSSSVTTVMVVGLVNACLMTLTQAIGVILGADIGTTITAWIVALNILEYGLPAVGIGGLCYLFTKKERARNISMLVMGIGMVFFGLALMKNGVRPVRTLPEFKSLFLAFQPHSIFGLLQCVFVGMIATAIIQSSSATVGITMVLASEGAITFDSAIALVIGENIGTTITAWLAALGTSSGAKRAAYAHIFIKIIGAVWIITVFPLVLPFLKFVFGPGLLTAKVVDGMNTYPTVMKAIALFHTGFNVVNVTLFLPFVPALARFLLWLKPEKADERGSRLTYLDVGIMTTPAIAIEQSRNEIIRMGEMVETMLSRLKEPLRADKVDEALVTELQELEDRLDVYQREIVVFLDKLLSGNVSREVVEQGRVQFRLADEYESIGDYIVRLVKMHRKLHNGGEHLTAVNRQELLDLHERVLRYINALNQTLKDGQPVVLETAKMQADEIKQVMKEYRNRYLASLPRPESSPLCNVVFSDSITAYRRIRGHALNIAQALAGSP